MSSADVKENQVIICARSSLLQMTTLQVAMDHRDNAKLNINIFKFILPSSTDFFALFGGFREKQPWWIWH